MSTNVIQAEYDTLDSIAARFGQQSIMSSALHAQVARNFQMLTQEGWEGHGADAFTSEMQSVVLPALQRLTDALSEAQSVTLQVRDVLQEAEEEAAQLFGGEGFVGESGNGSGGAAGATDGGGGIGWGTIAGIAAGGLVGGALGAMAGGMIGTVGIDGVITGIAGAASVAGGVVGAITDSPIYSAASDAVKHGGKALEQLSKLEIEGLKGTEIGSVIEGAGKAFKIAGYVTDVIDIADIVLNSESPRDLTSGLIGFAGGKLGAWGGGAIGGAVGGVIGGAIGSIFPGPGTVIGAGVGKVVGGVIGASVGDYLGKATFEPLGGIVYDVGEAAVAGIVDVGGHVGNFAEEAIDGVGGFISDLTPW